MSITRSGGGQNLLHRFLHPGVANKHGLRALIDAGVDLNAKGRFGLTPCRMALSVGPDLCLQLLEAGADPSIKNERGFDLADTLENRLSHLQPWQQADAYEPLIKWFEDNYRKIHWTKPKTAESAAQ